MKSLRFGLLAVLVLFQVSCSKDDDNPAPEEPHGIVGRWILEEYSYENTSTVKFGSSQDVTVVKGEATPKEAVLMLREDKTYIAEGEFTLTQTSSVNGETKTEEFELGFTGSGTYSMEGDIFIFDASWTATESGLIGEFDIVENSETELVLQSNKTRTDSENDVEVETVTKSYYRFSR